MPRLEVTADLVYELWKHLGPDDVEHDERFDLHFAHAADHDAFELRLSRWTPEVYTHAVANIDGRVLMQLQHSGNKGALVNVFAEAFRQLIADTRQEAGRHVADAFRSYADGLPRPAPPSHDCYAFEVCVPTCPAFRRTSYERLMSADAF